jgi:quinol-cytochrome oxidoreductase complex cytochrome b subunit
MAAFTGYLSQSNFDSQWIAVSAKDAMNSIGIGGFFNVLNFGQMYTFHVYLLPLVVSGLVVLHLLFVRLRGVVRPFPIKGERREKYRRGMSQQAYYKGVHMAPYDLVREVVLSGAVVLVLVVALASIFSSPDVTPLTLQSVATDRPAWLHQRRTCRAGGQ